MAKEKRTSPPSSNFHSLSRESPVFASSSDILDFDVVANLLQSEYPLIDSPLIIALLSDHHPGTLSTHLPEIRDQLGIIQATLVPDTDDPHEPDPSLIDELESKLDDLSIDNNGSTRDEKPILLSPIKPARSKVPSGGTGSASRSTEMSRSTSASSGESSNTSPTSFIDGEEAFSDEVEYLKGLFPATSVKIIRQALLTETSFSAAIDHLLSLELIKKVEDTGYWSGSDDGTGTDGETPSRRARSLTKPSPKLPQIEAFAREDSTGRSKSPKPKKGKKTKTVPLVDTLQRRSTPVSFRAGSARSSRTSSPVRSSPSSNAWGTVASLSMYLSELIPEKSQSYFLSYLHSPNYHSAYGAVRASLQALPRVFRNEEHDLSFAILQEMYGLNLISAAEMDDTTRKELELCTSAIEDVAGVMDMMDLLAEISEWPGDDDLEKYDIRTSTPTLTSSPLVPASPSLPKVALPATQSDTETSSSSVPVRAPPNPDRLLKKPIPVALGKGAIPEAVERIVPGSKAPLSSISSPTAHDGTGTFATISHHKRIRTGRQVHPLNWRTVDHHTHHRTAGVFHPHALHIPTYARGVTPHDSTPGSLFTTTPTISIDQCLTHATAERLKREEAIRAAGRHFRSTLPGGKSVNASVAGHYASEAREAGNSARQWELKAARIIVGNQLARGSTIDLHHLTIEEATTVAVEATGRWYEREKQGGFDGLVSQASQRVGSFVPGRGLTVITGVGRHSAGRKGVLGPAVANALEAAGWRVERGENGRGYLVVKGKR